MDGPALAGAAVGTLISVFANSIRRLPLVRYPYNHVAWAAAGAVAISWYDKKVEEAKKLAAERQRDKMERNVTFEA